MSYKKVLKIVLLFLFIGFASISCSFLTGDSGESSSTVKYTVEHYKQSVDGKQYELQNDDIEILTGNSSSKTKATPKEYEGFTVKEFKQESIAKNGNTVVKIYYDRNTITLTFDFAGGTDADGNESVTISGLYGTTITPPAPSKKGYFASSWTPALPQTFPKENTKFTANWEEVPKANYIVKHFLENLDGSAFEEKTEDAENLTGIINEATNASSKSYIGFTAKEIEQQKIAEDGTTVVNIYYTRNSYETPFIIKYEDKKDCFEFKLSGKYQEEINIPESYYPKDFKSDEYIPSYEPHKPTFFGDADKYEVVLNSKYEYYQRTDENNGIKIPFTCRDFRVYKETGSGAGFITAEIAKLYKGAFTSGRGHPDFENHPEEIEVETYLGTDGLPIFKYAKYKTTKESFDMWYRDYPGINITFRDKELVIPVKDTEKRIYEFKSERAPGGFFPIENEGFGNLTLNGYTHNYGFTADMSFYFTYNGEGKITITGDDDIWLFINGKLAIAEPYYRRESTSINLAGTKIEKTIGNEIKSFAYNADFDISEGQKVEIKIFHAERHSVESNFNLTLEGLDIYERRLK